MSVQGMCPPVCMIQIDETSRICLSLIVLSVCVYSGVCSLDSNDLTNSLSPSRSPHLLFHLWLWDEGWYTAMSSVKDAAVAGRHNVGLLLERD